MKTGRNIQRDIFLSSLRDQLDKMSEDYRKDDLCKVAGEYASQGMSELEVEELLVLDGFDTDLIHAYLTRTADNDDEEWGFELEDEFGRVTSNFDIDITITASSASEAEHKIGDLVDGKVVKIYRL